MPLSSLINGYFLLNLSFIVERNLENRVSQTSGCTRQGREYVIYGKIPTPAYLSAKYFTIDTYLVVQFIICV